MNEHLLQDEACINRVLIERTKCLDDIKSRLTGDVQTLAHLADEIGASVYRISPFRFDAEYKYERPEEGGFVIDVEEQLFYMEYLLGRIIIISDKLKQIV